MCKSVKAIVQIIWCKKKIIIIIIIIITIIKNSISIIKNSISIISNITAPLLLQSCLLVGTLRVCDFSLEACAACLLVSCRVLSLVVGPYCRLAMDETHSCHEANLSTKEGVESGSRGDQWTISGTVRVTYEKVLYEKVLFASEDCKGLPNQIKPGTSRMQETACKDHVKI